MSKKEKWIIEYRVYNLNLDLPALVLAGDKWRISDEISSRLHFHNCAEIGFCHSGEGALIFEGGGKLAFKANDVTIIPQYVPHTTYSKRGTRSHWSYVFLDFEELTREIWGDGKRGENHSLTPKDYLFNAESSPSVHFFANYLLEELQDENANREQSVRAAAFLLRNELTKLRDGRSPREESKTPSFLLKPALEYIRDNYMNRITIKELSDVCHVSENHFRRLFLSIMGTSPLNFVNSTRISRACALLDITDMPVFAVSSAVGISSFSSFNRNFKALTGLSPREYRRMKTQGDLSLKRKYVLTYQGWVNPEERPAHVMAEAEIEKAAPSGSES